MFGQKDASSSDGGSQVPSAPALPTSGFDPALITPATAPADMNMPQPVVPPMPTMSSFTMPQDTVPAPLPTSAPTPAPAVSMPSMTTSAPTTDTSAHIAPDDLVGMKQEALKHLQPLVGSLQQAPEEEFRTLMMMIQATDDKSLLKKALDAAKAIKDDKVRAQAMLDVINEINYFAQSGPQE